MDATPNEPRRRGGVLRKLLWIAAASVLLFVGALEALSRIADRVVAPRVASGDYVPTSANSRPPKGLWEFLALVTLDPASVRNREARAIPHPYLSYSLKPDYRTPPDSKQQCSHNSFGLRGPETTRQKPAGVFRIVTVGGSSVYGQSESKDEAVWSYRLERMLEEARPGLDVEVINGGCFGWTSFEVLINLELRMLDFEPDLVILYEAVNDMRAALYSKGGETQRDNTHWRAVWPVDRPSALEAWLEESGLRTYLVWRRYFTPYVGQRADLGYWTMRNYRGEKGVKLFCGGDEPWPAGWAPEAGFESYRRNLRSLVAVAREGGARTMFATQALMEWDFFDENGGEKRECARLQIDSFRRIQQIQREVAAETGALLGETAREIEDEDARAFSERGERLFYNDVHPTDAGSDVIARAVAKAVLESGVLPRRE